MHEGERLWEKLPRKSSFLFFFSGAIYELLNPFLCDATQLLWFYWLKRVDKNLYLLSWWSRAFQFLLQVSRENVGGAVCIWASGRAKNTAYPFTMDPDLFFPGGKFSVQQKRLSRHLQTFLLCTEINAAVPDWAEDDHFQRSPIHAHPKVPISMWANSCRCFLSIWSTTAVVQMVSTVFVLAPPVIAARLLTYFHIAMCCFRLWDINMFPAQISFLLSRQEWFRIQLEHET